MIEWKQRVQKLRRFIMRIKLDSYIFFIIIICFFSYWPNKISYLIHSFSYFFLLFSLLLLVETNVKYLFPLIFSKYSFILFNIRYNGYILVIFTYFLHISTPNIVNKRSMYFSFINFLIIGLCNSSANFLLEIFLLLIPLTEVFFIKKMYKPLKQDLLDIHHISDFQQY